MQGGWRNRIVGQGEKPASEFLANPFNWRIHPQHQAEALRGVLGEIGWVQNVVENVRTGNLIDGHLRVMEALRLGDGTPVPYIQVDLSEEEERLVLATLDPLVGLAVADKEKLEELLREVEAQAPAVQEMLAELAKDYQIDLAALDEREDHPEVISKADELQEKWQVQRGQIWLCGGHRVMCGDSTDKGDVTRLIQGQMARLMITDPPYGVAYETKGQNPRWRSDSAPIVNDDLGEAQPAFWADALKGWSLDGDAYVFAPPGPLMAALGLAVQETGIGHHQWLVWVKNTFSLGRSHYHYRHEHIFYGWRGKTSWNGSRTEDSVWECDKPSVSSEHPTMKPLPLVERALINSSLPRDVVIDPFLGSGTTLIAAEKLGRICFGMEIHPPYVAVTLQRYLDFTGDTPRLAIGEIDA